MAPPRKISTDQLAFLNSHVQEYLDCGSSRSLLTKFWTTVNAAFFVQWPERQALIENGNLPSLSEAPLPDGEEETILGKAIQERKKVFVSKYRCKSNTYGFKVYQTVVSKHGSWDQKIQTCYWERYQKEIQ